MRITKALATSMLVIGIASSSTFAATITFGNLPQATFGGSGIPNDSVAITTIQDGNRTITIGLTAHQRYSNPAVTNTGLDSNGAGTFYAVAGGDTFSGANSNSNYARWNIGYFVDFAPNAPLLFNPYSVSLLYDGKNPAFGDNPTNQAIVLSWLLGGSDGQGSLNLGMNSFPAGSFDPSAHGEYSFAVVVSKNGTELGRSSINVVVNDTGRPHVPPHRVPDGGTSLGLLGLALFSLAGIKRKFR